MISNSLSTSRKFASVSSEFGQALYMLLVAHSDDFGRQSGDAFTVKHQVFPTSRRPERDFERALDDLQSVGLILRYDVDGSRILQVLDFERHQSGLHKRSSSRFPEFPGSSGKIPEIPSELKGTEEKGIETKRTNTPRIKHAVVDDSDFTAFWVLYPRKTDKADARKAWAKLDPRPTLETLQAALAWQRTQPGWLKDGGQYVPHAATWLNKRRFEDEPFNPPNLSAKSIRNIQTLAALDEPKRLAGER